MYEELQEIYINLEEPDGMTGISYMITSGSRNQHLLQCESAGRWSEAQAYYEQALKTEPEWIKNHVGLYNSLENLGKFGKGIGMILRFLKHLMSSSRYPMTHSCVFMMF
jgi:serine/threonine-protein kinase ATR